MDEVIFDSKMKKLDYQKVSYYNIFLRKPWTSILMIIVLIAGITSLVAPQIFPAPLALSVLFLIYPFLLFGYCAVRIQKTSSEKLNKYNGVQKIIFRENGITFIRPGQQEQFYWGDISNFYETANYFLAYTHKNRILTMPKRDTEAVQLQKVRNIIINNFSFKNYRLKS